MDLGPLVATRAPSIRRKTQSLDGSLKVEMVHDDTALEIDEKGTAICEDINAMLAHTKRVRDVCLRRNYRTWPR